MGKRTRGGLVVRQPARVAWGWASASRPEHLLDTSVVCGITTTVNEERARHGVCSQQAHGGACRDGAEKDQLSWAAGENERQCVGKRGFLSELPSAPPAAEPL